MNHHSEHICCTVHDNYLNNLSNTTKLYVAQKLRNMTMCSYVWYLAGMQKCLIKKFKLPKSYAKEKQIGVVLNEMDIHPEIIYYNDSTKTIVYKHEGITLGKLISKKRAHKLVGILSKLHSIANPIKPISLFHRRLLIREVMSRHKQLLTILVACKSEGRISEREFNLGIQNLNLLKKIILEVNLHHNKVIQGAHPKMLRPRLTHGDISPHNIVIKLDPTNGEELIKLVDFENSAVRTSAVDLGACVFYSNFKDKAQIAAFVDRYLRQNGIPAEYKNQMLSMCISASLIVGINELLKLMTSELVSKMHLAHTVHKVFVYIIDKKLNLSLKVKRPEYEQWFKHNKHMPATSDIELYSNDEIEFKRRCNVDQMLMRWNYIHSIYR